MGSYRVGHDRSDLAVAAAAAEQYILKYIPASLSVNMSYHCPKNKKKNNICNNMKILLCEVE